MGLAVSAFRVACATTPWERQRVAMQLTSGSALAWAYMVPKSLLVTGVPGQAAASAMGSGLEASGAAAAVVAALPWAQARRWSCRRRC